MKYVSSALICISLISLFYFAIAERHQTAFAAGLNDALLSLDNMEIEHREHPKGLGSEETKNITTELESIIKNSGSYYGEIDGFPPNSRPFKIQFTDFDRTTSKFKGCIKYLDEGKVQIEINGSILGNELVFTEAQKKGVFTLTVKKNHRVTGVWRGNSIFGDEITREVWFAY